MQESAAWPQATVHLDASGSGTVNIGGTVTQIRESDEDTSRTTAIDVIAATAERLRRPIRTSISDSTGRWQADVHPDRSLRRSEKERGSHFARAVARTGFPLAGAGPSLFDAAVSEEAPDLSAEEAVEDVAPPVDAQETEQEAVPVVDEAEMEVPGTSAALPRRSFLEETTPDSEPAREGWQGSLNRLGLRLAPGAEELQRRQELAAVRQHWEGPRTIAVVNGKGGANKTPTTILLSSVFAREGGAGVLAWDNNQTRGTLGWRTHQAQHERTIFDLLPAVDGLLGVHAQAADLAYFTHHQPADRFDVLRSQPIRVASDQRIAAEDVDKVHAVVSKFYRLIIMDSGNDESDPMWLRMIHHTDQLVVATTTRDDHAEAGALLIEQLQQGSEHTRNLAANAVVVVSQADPHASPNAVTKIAEGYHEIGVRAAVTIPYDQAMVRGILSMDRLHPTTQRAWTGAAAAVARGL